MAKWLWKLMARMQGVRVGEKPDFSGEPIGIGAHLQTDLHCHLVPGVDDGAQNVEQSMAMIERLRGLGYSGSILTSHIYAELYPNNRSTLTPAFETLKAAVQQRWPDYRLHLAAEYFLDQHFEACIASDDLLWFPALDAEGLPVRCVLFEFGFHEPPLQAKDIVFQLQMSGYQPVLAHVERYPYWHQDLAMLEDLHERGVWLTLNAASLAGAYGPSTYAAARQVIERGWCRYICSDAHAMRHIESLEAIDCSPIVQTWVRNRGAAHHQGLKAGQA